MVNKKHIVLYFQILDKDAELHVLAEKMRVLAYAMTNIQSDNGADAAILYSIMLDILSPHLTVKGNA